MVRIYIPVELARRVREAAGERCGFCRSPQHLILGRLHIEHLTPLARGGLTIEENLWLSCSLCNNHKGDRITAIDPETREEVPLFNPRSQIWREHFRWSEDGLSMIGLTAIGRATVEALHLADDPIALVVRGNWVLAGWHPPKE